MSDVVYLKPNAIAEPLFNQWYAWSYLIPPATAAMYIAHSHLQILESFIASPEVHSTALKNPALLGGPFINYGGDKLEEIRDLCAKTRREQADLLSLARAFGELRSLLDNHAHGYSLEPLYRDVPRALSGYIELVYDSDHHPCFRLLEGLLYRSPYYKTTSQSMLLSLVDGDRRSFVLSTPRLVNVHNLHIRLPFSDRRWDSLFALRERGGKQAEIAESLGIKDRESLAAFLTTVPPVRESRYGGEGVRVRYFGHACLLMETASVSILCDPLIGYEQVDGIPRYSYSNLPEVIDYVLITHNHQDHVMLETLLQLRYKINEVIVPKSHKGSLLDPSLKLILQQLGFARVREIDELESLPIPEGQIVSWPFLGEHGDLDIAAKTAYLIQLQGKSILCAADSNNLEPKLYDHLYHLWGSIDLLFLGMECEGAPYTWAYGALLNQTVAHRMAQTRRLDGSDAQKAISLVERLQAKQVYVYAMGQEPWLSFITSIHYKPDSKAIVESNQLIEYCRRQGKVSERLFGCKEIFLNHTASTVIPADSQASLKQFLRELDQFDIKLWVEGEKLRCNAPKGALTPQIKEQIQERKSAIIEFLQPPETPAPVLEIDRSLDPQILPPPFSSSRSFPQTVLLTGATGFLGAFLLSSLLQDATLRVECLVRAATLDGAKERMKERLLFYGLEQESWGDRLILRRGDLALPFLGLAPAEFAELAQTVTAIYHNGAWVHHGRPYSSLRETNVCGTQEILRLACQTCLKPVHFLSTVSVFSRESGREILQETENVENYPLPQGGYARSKWVAEQLIVQARSRGVPANIYRLGPVSGHSRTGVFNPNDFLYRLMIGYAHLGIAPEGERMLDILPVDYASQAIVHLSRKEELLGQTFHLVHPRPVSSEELFAELGAWGYPIQRLPYAQWYAKLLEIAQGSPDHVLYPLVSLFSAETATDADLQGLTLSFACHNTEQGLAGSGIHCPPLNRSLWRTYLAYLTQQGLLAPSEQHYG